MKAINYMVSLSLTICSTFMIQAQEVKAGGQPARDGKNSEDYRITVQNTKDGKITLNDFSGDLPVEGYNGTEIIVTSDRGHETPSRAKGLKPVYADGTDNTGIGVSIENRQKPSKILAGLTHPHSSSRIKRIAKTPADHVKK